MDSCARPIWSSTEPMLTNGNGRWPARRRSLLVARQGFLVPTPEYRHVALLEGLLVALEDRIRHIPTVPADHSSALAPRPARSAHASLGSPASGTIGDHARALPIRSRAGPGATARMGGPGDLPGPPSDLALGVLRRLAGALQAVLLAFLHPRVAGQEPGLAERQHERPPDRTRAGPGRCRGGWPRPVPGCRHPRP